MAYLKGIGLFLIAALCIAFAVSNRGMVEVGLFPFPYTLAMPLFLLLVISFFLGALLGSCFGVMRQWKQSRKQHQLQQRLSALEEENRALQVKVAVAHPVAPSLPERPQEHPVLPLQN